MIKNDFLIIKYMNRNSFEKYFSEQMMKEGISVLDEDDIYPNLFDSSKNKIVKLLNLWRYKKIINKYKNIVVFADGRLPVVLTYYLKNSESKLIIWRWNSIGKVDYEFNKLKKYGEIWTFDKRDAELNGWRLNTQFYFKNNTSEKILSKKNGAYFVGDNKGREDELKKLYMILTEYNIKCDFWISNKRKNSNMIENIEGFISYEKVVEDVKEHSILIDLVKSGQTGMTIRTMESLFFEKKLIGNNAELKNADFYDPDNIFIITENNTDGIDEFLKKDYKKVQEPIIDRYDFKAWLHRFEE